MNYPILYKMKRMKYKWLLFGLTLGVVEKGMTQNSGSGKIDLQQAIETGLKNNLDVKRSETLMQSSRVDWNQARLNQLPSVDGSASSGINQGRSIDPFTNSFVNQQINFSSYGLSAGVVLFNGFSMKNAVKQNEAAYDASRMDWQQVRDNLTIQIILAYLQVLTNEDQLAQATNQAKLSKEQVDRLIILDQQGAIPPSDLSDLRGQNANDQLAIISSRNALATSKLTLCQLLNIPYDASMQLERVEASQFAMQYTTTPDSIYQTALSQFAQVRAASMRTRSWEYAVKAERGRLFPTLSLSAGATTNYSSAARSSAYVGSNDVITEDYVTVNGTQFPVVKKIDDYTNSKIPYGRQLNNNLYSQVSLNLRVPIFSNWQQRNRIRVAQLNLENTRAVEKTAQTQLQQAIEQAYVNMTAAWDRYHALLEQVQAYEQSFKAAEVRFNAGVGNTIDYLTAKNNWDRSNINLIAARYDYLLRTKVLDYYQGRKLF
jgi:outer membrane protein